MIGWTMDNGQWTMDYGQWTMDNGLWTMDRGQRSFVSKIVSPLYFFGVRPFCSN